MLFVAKIWDLYVPLIFSIAFNVDNFHHGFLYYTRTDFMPSATLKIRPNYFNVL